MNNNIEAFASTYQQCFPGTTTPPMPKKVDELSLTNQIAIRDANPGLWQSMFAGHGERLPADVEARLVSGDLLPCDGPALRKANWDVLALQCEQQREQIMASANDRQIEASRKEHEAAMARNQQWAGMSLLERMSMSPVSEAAAAQAREQWGITGN